MVLFLVGDVISSNYIRYIDCKVVTMTPLDGSIHSVTTLSSYEESRELE